MGHMKPPEKISERFAMLPPQERRHRGKKTLVLDLDETLAHTAFEDEFHDDHDFEVFVDRFGNQIEIAYVFKRPFLAEFLRDMAEIFELIVFTASDREYADQVIDEIDVDGVISHRLYRDSCREIFPGGIVKDLSLLGREMKNVILVDNNEFSYMLQPENAIPILDFYCDSADRKLAELSPLLCDLATVEDVTEILARNRNVKRLKRRIQQQRERVNEIFGDLL